MARSNVGGQLASKWRKLAAQRAPKRRQSGQPEIGTWLPAWLETALRPVDLGLSLTLKGIEHGIGTERFYQHLSAILRFNLERGGLDVEGVENIPSEGGVIIAVNHQSWLDVQVLLAACPRRLRFMAKEEFEHWPLLGQLIRFSGSPFIKRGGDELGMQQAIEQLRAGNAIAVFPEGTIPGEERKMRHHVEPETGLLRGHTGVIRLAKAAGVPIVPLGLSGTSACLPPEIFPRLELLELPKTLPLTARFGTPMVLEEGELDYDGLRVKTNELMGRISALIDHHRNYIPQTVPVPPLPRHEKLGVLLLHGFTSGLRTVSGLLPYLEKQGIPYRMPVLRGHSGFYTDLEGVTWKDWYEDAETALLDLAKEVDKVAVVGLSMGGLVALNLGMKHEDKVAAVVTLAAALRFKDPLAGTVPVLSKFIESWPSPNAFNDLSLKAKSENYERFMTSAFASLYAFARETESNLHRLRVPVCVLHSKKDQVIAPVAANIIYRDVSSMHREIHWFFQSGHEMGQDLEAEKVFETVMAYLEKHRAQG
ncbi:MAG: alpha/beta fold hydrolase [Myxococcota bacterium]|jgi:1-acyl-sn-glycerol-3-phosphate acyltransferase|nr:alpha/beta fold hydrolase [Myxococcota bacterium]